MSQTYSGYIGIIGRPNVGKSTLLNYLLGQKISIISRKPQTTRNRILGIKTDDAVQMIFVDTPGIHFNPVNEINRYMIRTALTVIPEIDVIIFVVDARRWTDEDDLVLSKIKKTDKPIIIVLNKIDRVINKDTLLPTIENINNKIKAADLQRYEIVPLSAKTGDNVTHLESLIRQLLPEGPFFFPEDQITDKTDRFMAAELIREKILRLLGEEVPHKVAIEIESFRLENKILHISAIIWVERPGQKKIIIGTKGEQLKAIGRLARLEMEEVFGSKVFLRLWIKVKEGWTDDLRALLSLGYRNE